MTDRLRANPTVTAALAAAVLVVVAVLLWLFQPWALFIDETVDEAFPVAADAQEPDPVAGAGGDASEEQTAPSEEGSDQETHQGPADAPSEETTAEPSAAATADTSEAPASEPPSEQASPTPSPSPSPSATPTGPTALRTGTFVSRDHQTSGTATVYELEDGSLTLRIEDLATDNGPDLFVYLDDDGPQAAEPEYDDGLSLGRLKGNQGNQNYTIPPDTDLESLTTVVIWCDRFASAFGTVALEPV